MIGDTDIASVQATTAAAPKKKMGFLQRMTSSSSSVHKDKEAQKHGALRRYFELLIELCYDVVHVACVFKWLSLSAVL